MRSIAEWEDHLMLTGSSGEKCFEILRDWKGTETVVLAKLAEAEARVRELEARVRELEARAGETHSDAMMFRGMPVLSEDEMAQADFPYPTEEDDES